VAVRFALLLLPVALLPALEVGGTFRLGNMAFAYDREEADTTFAGRELQWGLSLFVRQALTEQFTFSSAFQRDQILRNVAYNTVTFRQSFLRIGVGPFFGVFNSRSAVLKPGISTSVQIEFPGVAYLLFRSDSSIGGRLVEVGDYTPYKVLLSFAYQHLTRSFIHADVDAPVRHALNSIVLGTTLDLYVTPFLTTTVELESSVYTFGGEALLGISNPGPAGYLFRAYAGVTLNTDHIPAQQQ
jgi:hypothetical protein